MSENKKVGVCGAVLGALLLGSWAVSWTDPLQKVAVATNHADSDSAGEADAEVGDSLDNTSVVTTVLKPAIPNADAPPALDVDDASIGLDVDAEDVTSDAEDANGAEDIPEADTTTTSGDERKEKEEVDVGDLANTTSAKGDALDLSTADPLVADSDLRLGDVVDATDGDVDVPGAGISTADSPATDLSLGDAVDATDADVVDLPNATADSAASDVSHGDILDVTASDAVATSVDDNVEGINPIEAAVAAEESTVDDALVDSPVAESRPSNEQEPVISDAPAAEKSATEVANDDDGVIILPAKSDLEPTQADAPESADAVAPTAPSVAAATPLKPAGKPFLGVGIRDVANTRVTTLYGKSTAEKLGIKVGDELVSINSKTITNYADLVNALSGMKVGDVIQVTVLRKRQTIELAPTALLIKPNR